MLKIPRSFVHFAWSMLRCVRHSYYRSSTSIRPCGNTARVPVINCGGRCGHKSYNLVMELVWATSDDPDGACSGRPDYGRRDYEHSQA